MLRDLKNELATVKVPLIIMVIVLLVGTMLGNLISLLIAFDQDFMGKYIDIGILFALLLGVMYLGILYTIQFITGFQIAIKMSITRKRFLKINSIMNIVYYIVFIIMLFGVNLLNNIYIKLAFPNMTIEFGLFDLINLKIIALGIVLLYTITVTVGAVITKFGLKALVVLYVLWLVLTFSTKKLIFIISKATEALMPLNTSMISILVLSSFLVVALLIFISIRSLLKTVVRV